MGKFFVTLIAALFVLSIISGLGSDEPAPPKSKASSSTANTAPSPPEPPPEPQSPWRVSQWNSAMDDSPAVSLTTQSEGVYNGAYGGPSGSATLRLRCLENTTSLYIKLNGHFLADIQGYGRVPYRIDDQQQRTMRMRESTDNKALGLWTGGQAIPVIRRLFNHDQIIMRVTPFNQSAVTVTFPIDGIEEKIQPLREACHW